MTIELGVMGTFSEEAADSGNNGPSHPKFYQFSDENVMVHPVKRLCEVYGTKIGIMSRFVQSFMQVVEHVNKIVQRGASFGVPILSRVKLRRMSSRIHLAKKDSNTLAKTGVREIGRSWSRELMFLSLGIGAIVAVFQQLGKTPS
jgi:hypothetical protein